ncbi:MAG: class I SAM-dependent methyltransferase [Thermodesulfobacteriota bacterium]
MSRPCRLCGHPAIQVYEDDRPFFACNICGLIFSDCLISTEAAEKHYQDQYKNAFDWDKEALAFVAMINQCKHSPEPSSLSVLDYGSGGGFLTEALRRKGFTVDGYEPMIHGEFEEGKYSRNYDVVILNEVLEHLPDINKTFDLIYDLVAPQGIMILKTLLTDSLINDPEHFLQLFKAWWYKDDPTHISFFSSLTFEFLCRDRGRNLEVLGISSTENCLVLKKG